MSTPTITPQPTTETPVQTPVVQEPYSVVTKEDGSVEVSLQTGERFSGSPDDVIKTLAKAKYDTGLAYRGLKDELTQVREQLSPISAALQPKPPQPTAEEVSQRQLREFMAEQTAQYLEYPSAAEMKRDLTGIRESKNKSEQNEQTVAFYAKAQDFPGGEDNSNKLIEVAMKYGIVDTHTGPDGNAYITKFPSANQLMAAHALAIRDGVYKPLTPEEQAVARGAQYQSPRPPVAPPTLGGTQPEVTHNNTGVNLWNIPREQLREQLTAEDKRRLGIR